MRVSTKKLTLISMLSALGVALVFLIHFSIFPAVPFLEYDPADIPILFVTLIFGPLEGLVMTFVVSIIQGVTVSAGAGFVGVFMHIVATGSMVIAVGLVKKCFASKPKFSLVAAGSAGIITMTAVMVILDIVIMPLYMNVPLSVVLDLIWYIVAFNLIKAGINVGISLILFIPLQKVIRRFVF